MLKDLIVSFARLLIPFFLICFVSRFFVKLFNVSDLLEKIIFIFLLNWLQFIAGLEILSLFNQIKIFPLILFHFTCALVCLIIAFFKKLNLKISFRGLWLKIKSFYKELKLNKVLLNVMLLWLILILITTFFIGITVPPNNYDSMTYHLARAAFWHQNNTINHYFTRISRQVENPINAELGLLWIITFSNSDNLAFLVQWFSFLILIITLYKILRLLRFEKKIAFITIFIFTTLDIILLESNTTQNDLVTAGFVLITLFLLIKILKSDKILLPYLILAGGAFSLFIGTKGYSYLFIPGFILFFLIYGKNGLLKFKQFLLLICFCTLGTLMFASYNFVQNYISFNNIFSSQQNLDLMRVINPNWKTFISNISRHLSSFYQFKNYDFGFSNFIQKVLDHIHYLLKLEISAPSTTIEGQNFYLRTPVFSEDASYFGPIFLIFILPSIFYNLIYFVVLKIKKKAEFLRTKWIETIKIAVITVIFFIIYNYVFVWQPWAGRLFIPFASLMMINFAMLVDFNNNLNKKVLFKIILTIIIIVSITFSFINLFFNEFKNIIAYKNKSIFSVNYDDRRYYLINPQMGKVNNMINSILGDKSKIGLITGNNDWDYIYFGKNFSRGIKYISDEEITKESIKNIFKENNFNAIIINTENISGLYDQLFTHSIIKVTGSDFLKYFKAINQCKLLLEENDLHVQVLGDSASFQNIEKLSLSMYRPLLFSINLYSDKNTELRIYYRNENEDFNEENSVIYKVTKGNNKIDYFINKPENLKYISINPANESNIVIKEIDFLGIDENWNFKIEDNFLLLY